MVRRRLLIGLASYFIMRVWSGLFFIREMATDPLSSELFSAIPGLLQLFHHERKTGDTERLGANPRTTT